jgi:copper chaperone CopZ
MDRRKFISAAAGVSMAGAAAATENRSVVYRVNDFTCITCAVGLEVMLRGLKGVTRANASYPEKKVSIGYDSNVASEKELKAFIANCGFSVV